MKGPKITPNYVFNRIQLARFSNKTRSFVLVEGPTDETLWSHFIPSSICKLQRVCGKPEVMKLLKSDSLRRLPGFAGIVDADYWLISESPELQTDNLLYDECYPDAEIILLRSSTLTDVIAEKLGHCDYEEVRRFTDQLQSAAEKLAMEFGYFRLLSYCKGYEIGFREFWESHLYDEFIDSDSLTIRSKRFAQRLADDHNAKWKRNPDKWFAHDAILDEVNELRKKYETPNIKLCQGHEVVAITSYLLPFIFQTFFGHSLTSNLRSLCRHRILERSLREKYRKEYFRKSSLHDSIKNWESPDDAFRILKPDI